MGIKKDIEAHMEKFLKECDAGEEEIKSFLENIAKKLVSSDILFYNTITYYQYEHKIISEYTPKSPPAGYPSGDIELGPMLYWLTNDQPPSDWKLESKVIWKMLQIAIDEIVGKSTISTKLYGDLFSYIKETGIPTNNGTLLGLTMYQQLDYHWLEAAIHYVFYKLRPKDKAPFNSSTPTPIGLKGATSGEVKIAIIGDWGAGKYDPEKTYDEQDGSVNGPAVDIMNAVSKLNPDYIIHLGDVYYAGTDGKAIIAKNEEQDNLLNVWSPSASTNFTLNSNHEMYDGANGYFNVALANKLFSAQANRSFFALEYGDWVILGLDSAYYCDDDNLYMNGRITDEAQLKLLNNYKGSDKKVILMTHHNATEFDGSSLVGKKDERLWDDVTATNALGGAPDYWYWSHIHLGVAYSEKTVIGKDSITRCIGHSAIPNGTAWGLLKDDKNIPAVDYFANTPVDNTAMVYNGFSMLTLTDSALKEQFYELDSTGGAVVKWSS